MKQINASMLKDVKGLVRSFRLYLLLAIGGFCSIVQPLTLKFLPDILKMLEMPDEYLALIPQPNLLMSVSQLFADLTDLGVLVLLISIMAFIGGEQKKKSLTIPFSKGLKIESYVFSKFILYPLIAFIFAFSFCLIGYFFSVMLFSESFAISAVLLSSLLVSLEVMFLVVLCTTIGLLTGRPGIGVALIYITRIFIISILSLAKANRFSPYAMTLYAVELRSALSNEALISVIITIGVMTVLILFTYFYMKKRVIKF